MNVADIAKKSFDGVARKLSGVIHPFTLTTDVTVEYNPASGTVTRTPATYTGRCIFASQDAAPKMFPFLELKPADDLVYLEGMQHAPKENDAFSAAGRTGVVIGSRDLVRGGGLFVVVIR